MGDDLAGDWDVVVVGAGSSGCALAARLADTGRRVLLLEAGADHARPEDFPPELRDAATLRAVVPGHRAAWDLTGMLPGGRTVHVPRGRVVGGSSTVNAGYFVRGTPADFDGWAAAGNHLWSHEQVLPAFRRLEDDRDFGDRPGHGRNGPVPVARRAPAPGLPEAFGAAARELGFPAEPDKNAGSRPGYGPIPFTVVDGVRVNTAMAYLAPRRTLPTLSVRGGVEVLRVLVAGGRAVGVQTTAGAVRAGEVVLSAGAVGSPHLLLRSGIGPAERLRAAGTEVVADLPGVGEGASEHPLVYLRFRPAEELGGGSEPLHGVLHATSSDADGTGDLELLPWLVPFDRVLTGAAARGADVELGVSLMRPRSRGRLVPSTDPAGPPRIDYRHLSEAADRRRLREGVRLAAELLSTRALRGAGTPGGDLADRGFRHRVLPDDAGLDRWLRGALTTAHHLAGTARMGPDDDPDAVVDQQLRVRGVPGLRVVDASVMPQVPSRGTAATAVMVGERAAELIAG